MPRFKQGFREKILDNADIMAYISRYTRLSKKGGRYFGLCPFPDHNEHTGSFSVVPEKGFFYCFGCHKGGNIIDFVMEMNRLTYGEALELLAREMNITPEYEEGFRASSDSYTAKKVIFEMNRAAGNFFFKNLVKNKDALDYLKNRGVPTTAISDFALGLSPTDNSLSRYLQNAGYKKKDIEAANLARENERGLYDFFRGRIMFPIQEISGEVVGFGGRIMTSADNGPKYLNSPENDVFLKRSMLYNLNRAKDAIKDRTTPIIMVEGYMDVISLYEHGIKAVCATLGTALGEKHARLIKRYTDSVILCYDGDAPGRNAAVRGCGILTEAGLSAKVMSLPGDHDPDSYVREYGADEFMARASEAMYAEDFKISELKRKYDLSDIQSRSLFLTEACEVVALVRDEIKWDYYARKLAALTDSEISSVKRRIVEISRHHSDEKSYVHKEEPPKEEPLTLTPQMLNELAVLKYIAQSYHNYQNYIDAGGANLFDGENAELYEEMSQMYEKDNNVDINRKIMYNEILAKNATLMNFTDNDIKDSEVPFYVNVLTINILNARLKSLKKQIDNLKENEFDTQDGTERQRELLTEYAYLKQKLMELKMEVNT